MKNNNKNNDIIDKMENLLIGVLSNNNSPCLTDIHYKCDTDCKKCARKYLNKYKYFIKQELIDTICKNCEELGIDYNIILTRERK